MCLMAKSTSINLRISREFREEIETLAKYHGLTMSSYAHSLLVRTIRYEKEQTPEAFAKQGVRAAEVSLAPVVAEISPSDETLEKERIRRDLKKTG